MTAGPKSILAELKERRDKMLLKLRDREPDIAAKLIQLNAAISGIEAGCPEIVKDEFSGFRKPSDALFAYLALQNKSCSREAMCDALVRGGYGRGTKRPYWDLIRSVDYQVSKHRLKELNGLIGKSEWPNSMFKE